MYKSIHFIKKNVMKKITGIIILCCVQMMLQAQERNFKNDFRAIQVGDSYDSLCAVFDAWYNTHGTGRGTGYKQYARWKEETRNHLDGNKRIINATALTWQNYYAYERDIKNNASQKAMMAPVANWQSLGPTNVTLGPTGYGGGVGRVNTLAFQGNSFGASTFWVGTPAGGIWKTNAGGNSWTSISNGLPVLGVSGICVHPTNANIIYILTGDGDGGHTNSVGVLKSINGGLTWNTTGLQFNVTSFVSGYKLMMDPTNSNVLYAATSTGLWKTTDAGSTWFINLTGNARDIEFKPGNSSTVYCATDTLVKYSTNSGSTWNTVVGLPITNIARIAIAVTPAAPNNVYALLGQSNKIAGFRGFYVSNNSGANFNFKSNSPYILGGTEFGAAGDSSTQSGYDLSLAVHNTNPAIVMVGGINIYRSVDTGATWTMSSHWVQEPDSIMNDTNYVHADIHDLRFTDNDNVLYACSDGGIFRSYNNGNTWSDISTGLNIAQFYTIDINQSDNTAIMGGAQDNGCSYMNVAANTNVHVKGGDGLQVAIQPSNKKVIYYSWQNGGIFRSDSGGTSAIESYISPPTSGKGVWLTPYIIDKQNENRLYAGYRRIFRSNNKGATWTNITDTLPYLVSHLALNTINNQLMIRVILYSYIERTTNALATKPTFTFVNDTDIAWPITDVVFNDQNATQAVLTMGGYNANKKVVYSNDGGLTWTPINAGLPNVPIHCAVFHPAAFYNYIFVGTDVGVYMYNLSTGGPWVAYNNGLPNVIVKNLKVYAATNTLVAGTFSRGVWSTPLPQSCSANFIISNTSQSSALEYWRATNNITSTDSMSWGNGAAVTYKADTYIQLNPGFYVGNTMTFNANIEPCTNNNLLAKQTGTLEGPMVPEFASDMRTTNAEDSKAFDVFPVPIDKAFTIRFLLEEPSDVTVTIYDIQGNYINTVIQENNLDRGVYSQDISADEWSAGIYIVKLIKGKEVMSKRITKM
jgi:hypothetical protein